MAMKPQASYFWAWIKNGKVIQRKLKLILGIQCIFPKLVSVILGSSSHTNVQVIIFSDELKD